MKIKKIITLALLLFSVFSYGQKSSKSTQPNIVLLFVDDMGWSDLGYRNEKLHTPNIDQLKNEGVDFTRAYIATPTCSPSRASMLTGKEPARMEIVRHMPSIEAYQSADGKSFEEYHSWPKDPVQMPSRNWLPLEEITYAERLKEFGYYNMFIGKWHLGHDAFFPEKQGFDAQYGTSVHGHPKSYYAPFFKTHNPLPEFTSDDYLTDVLTANAEEFIEQYNNPQPFMLSMWYYTVHGPHVGRKDLVEKYKAEGLTGKYAKYAAMISVLDESVGRVRKALDKKGIADNTVILFISDQGGAFSNAPLRGGKRGGYTLCEGGARVPFIVYYPNVTKPNSSCNTPVQSLDIYPTLIELASGKPCADKQINGVSLLPLLHKKKIKKRNLFFFRSYEDQYAAVMRGNWKLIKYHSGLYELYNLTKDVSEAHNLYNTETKRAEELTKALSDWEKEAIVTR